jgi:hypothetical protein
VIPVTHKRRPERTQPNDGTNPVGSCPHCGRPVYLTRKAAKRAAAQARGSGGRAGEPRKCGGNWHLG